MEKSIHSRKYAAFLETLRRVREERGLIQSELANRLGATQSFVSKCERGERRLDVVELIHWCEALGMPWVEFAALLEAAVGEQA